MQSQYSVIDDLVMPHDIFEDDNLDDMFRCIIDEIDDYQHRNVNCCTDVEISGIQALHSSIKKLTNLASHVSTFSACNERKAAGLGASTFEDGGDSVTLYKGVLISHPSPNAEAHKYGDLGLVDHACGLDLKSAKSLQKPLAATRLGIRYDQLHCSYGFKHARAKL